MPSKRRILCVDDHEHMCSLITTILSDYEVVAELGQQQIQSVNAQGLIRKDELPDALVPAVANLLT
jgi:CheY-like chemotaxis protein